MKKILIATTALVATAGVAAAEVAVSGDGRMGVVYNGDDLNFSSRIRVVFTLSGETDGGLQFGGSFRADNAGNAANGSAGNVYISGAFGKLAMGDVVGAAESVIGDLPEVGFQDVGNNDIIYITGDSALTSAGNPVALYTYSTGALSFALSMSDGNNPSKAGSLTGTNSTGTCSGTAVGPLNNTCLTNGSLANKTREYAVGVKYTMDAFSVALAYEVSDPDVGSSAKHLIVGAEGTFGDTTVKGFYGDGSGAINGFKHYGIGVTSKFDAITVKGFVQKQDDNGDKLTSWGLGGEYSLGGGATVAFGLSDDDEPGSKVQADFGLKFKF